MSKITDIIREYADGKKTVEETNAALRDAGAGFILQPDKQQITPEEILQGDERSGFGMLDTGTGTLDKVEIKDMQLVNCDVGSMIAFVKFNGKLYGVAQDGKTLVEVV